MTHLTFTFLCHCTTCFTADSTFIYLLVLIQLLCDFFYFSCAYFRIDFLPTLLILLLIITRKSLGDYASQAKINTFIRHSS